MEAALIIKLIAEVGLPLAEKLIEAAHNREQITPAKVAQIRALHELAQARGQSLAQMALAWVLRQPAVTTALARGAVAGIVLAVGAAVAAVVLA